MSKIDLTINREGLAHNIQKAKENNIIIPTIAQMQNPDLIPEKIKEKLTHTGLWDVDPVNLFRISWHNEAKESGGLYQKTPNYVEIPSSVSGVPCRILAMSGKWFPTGCHKVGASFGCLAPRLVTGQFDATYHHAVWPSTGNYCRGGAFNSKLLACDSVAILPQDMSKERFDWLKTIAGQIIATPGCESNVKEIFDKTWELKQDPSMMIFNQFAEMGNPLWHYNVTGNALADVYEAIKRGVPFETIYNITKIDPWFLAKLQGLAETELALAGLRGGILTEELYRTAKMQGFLDKTVLRLTGLDALPFEKLRASYKMVDTCAAEFSAKTPYFYSTFDEENEAAQFIAEHPSDRKKVLVFGSGPIRIGQGIEFDYCCVHCALALRKLGYETIMVNCNPETVSTDYDTSDKLYFEPLTFEDVMSIYRAEKPVGIIAQFGGQTPLNLARSLQNAGARILGTSPAAIDLAEDRDQFREMMEKLNIPMPKSGMAVNTKEALAIAKEIGYPLMVRPSYVLGGRGMEVVHSDDELSFYMEGAIGVTPDRPILIDRFLMHATEVEADAVCDGTDCFVPSIMQHIELAGIHSGDSACVLPPVSLSKEIQATIEEYTKKIALSLDVCGLMNMQYAIADGEVYVLEANPRASRTVPLVSKVCGINMVKAATEVIIAALEGKKSPVAQMNRRPFHHFGVKEAVLPFNMFQEVDPILGPEMRSTGEVLGLSDDFGEAFYKSQEATGLELPLEGTVLISVNDNDKPEALEVAKDFVQLGFTVLATGGTYEMLQKNGVEAQKVNKIFEGAPHIGDYIQDKKIQLIINTPIGKQSAVDDSYIRKAAIKHKLCYMTTIAAAQAAVKGIRAVKSGASHKVKSLQEFQKD